MDERRRLTVPPPPTESRGDGDALQRRLAERSLTMRVEGRGGVAVLVPEGGPATELDATMRRWIVQQGRDAGFASIALEIPEPVPAPVPERAPTPEPTPTPTPTPDANARADDAPADSTGVSGTRSRYRPR